MSSIRLLLSWNKHNSHSFDPLTSVKFVSYFRDTFLSLKRHIMCFIIQCFIRNAHWAVPVHSPQSLPAIQISNLLLMKRNYEVSSLLRRSIRRKIWEDNFRFDSVWLQPRSLQIKYIYFYFNVLFLFLLFYFLYLHD